MEETPLEKALQTINSKTPAVQVGNKVSFQIIVKEAIPALITSLVEQNMLIYEVNAAKSTLEDKFFDLIGENVIDYFFKAFPK